jgi:phosphotransferase system enzyme I (PtsI)
MNRAFRAEKVLQGLPLSGGRALAQVCRLSENRHTELEIRGIRDTEVDREIERVLRATEIVRERLEALRAETLTKTGKAEAEIFAAQRSILSDASLQERIAAFVRENRENGEAAVAAVLDSYESRLREMDDEILRGRASDIGEIRQRLLDALTKTTAGLLCAGEDHCRHGRNRIVVAEELTPGLTMELDAAHTVGFVTGRGGTNSHAAILARALGIPAVSGIPGTGTISCGTELLIDGEAGKVFIWPGAETRERYAAAPGAPPYPVPVDPVIGLQVMANISRADEVHLARAERAEGIGLYRTEFEFIAAGRALSEDEQLERYAAVVRAMDGRLVTFRMLDVGGEKPLPSLRHPAEVNPALGFRGSRVLARHPELLGAQARAIARAAAFGPVQVMYPMVVDLEQFLRLRDMFRAATRELEGDAIRQGVMFEVPSACLQAEEILAEADFGSIGTNDLTQYFFAVDRDNDLVADDYEPDRPVFWSLLGALAGAAAKTGRPLSICGEMAGRPEFAVRFHELGVETLSVSPRMIPGVRRALRAPHPLTARE